MDKKRIFRAIVAVAMMLITCLPSLAHDFEVDGIYYKIISSTANTVGVTFEGLYATQPYSGNVTIPAKVTYNGIEYSVIEISTDAFVGNCKIDMLTFEKSDSPIHCGTQSVARNGCDNTFNGCTINFLNIERNITGDAFGGCSLGTVYFAKSVTKIGNGVFSTVTTFNELIIIDSEEPLSVGYYYFSNTHEGGGMFKNCPIKSVYIGRDLEYSTEQKYGYSPFYNNTTISTVILGENVSKVGEYLFGGCTAIRTMKVYNPSVPVVAASNSFSSSIYEPCELYVPNSSLADFQTAFGWKNFYKIYSLSVPAEDISISTTNVESIILNKGEKLQLNVDFTPETTSNKKLTWTSENENVVSVDENGNISALSVGTATIEVISQDNSDIKKQCLVTVVDLNSTGNGVMVDMTLSHHANGKITTSVPAGESQTYVFEPLTGWVVHTITFNGENVTEQVVDNTYTTPVISEASELIVTYENRTDVSEVIAADRVNVTASNGVIRINGTVSGENVALYTSNGVLVNSVVSNENEITFSVESGEVYIIKTTNRTVKVAM